MASPLQSPSFQSSYSISSAMNCAGQKQISLISAELSSQITLTTIFPIPGLPAVLLTSGVPVGSPRRPLTPLGFSCGEQTVAGWALCSLGPALHSAWSLYPGPHQHRSPPVLLSPPLTSLLLSCHSCPSTNTLRWHFEKLWHSPAIWIFCWL